MPTLMMMMNDNNDAKNLNATHGGTTPCVNQNDKLVQQLLKKLDEGSETILNLRSLLTLKTVELNQLVHQLELIDQVLMHVENGTEQIEMVLKNMVSSSKDQQDELMNAEAILDTAIKSACSLYSDSTSVNATTTTTTTSILNKIAGILDELNITSTLDLYINDDIQVLQKAYMDLVLAKAIATCIRTDFKHRNTLLKKKHDSIKAKRLGDNIRNQVKMYQSYTRNAPFVLYYGKQDIMTILNREDRMIASRKMAPNRQLSSTNIPKKRQSSSSPSASSSPLKIKSRSTTTSSSSSTRSTLQMISRPTLTFMAKSKRNPTSRMMNQHCMMGGTVC